MLRLIPSMKKAEIRVCPVCGGPVEFATLFLVTAHYHVNPRTGRIARNPVVTYVVEDESGNIGYVCPKCGEITEFTAENDKM